MAHEFRTTRLTGNTVCDKCGLLPLDSDDIDIPCAGDRVALSSNAFSVDDQTADAISYLSHTYETLSDDFVREFPEYNHLVWSGSWVDTEASGVDVEYMSWVVDWIEQHTTISWDDGEPYDYPPDTL